MRGILDVLSDVLDHGTSTNTRTFRRIYRVVDGFPWNAINSDRAKSRPVIPERFVNSREVPGRLEDKPRGRFSVGHYSPTASVLILFVKRDPTSQLVVSSGCLISDHPVDCRVRVEERRSLFIDSPWLRDTVDSAPRTRSNVK